ncbi:MAG: transposase [Desulfobacula sp.]|jgi:transposase|nr:transposase [Desulfobacula sp.]
MIKHWQKLTRFLHVPGAPLDNNICEQALKRAILHRKNAMFYKTQHGANIGDIFMSLIHTCNLMKINPFKYLVALQKNSSALFKDPSQWMPWNYESAMAIGK